MYCVERGKHFLLFLRSFIVEYSLPAELENMRRSEDERKTIFALNIIFVKFTIHPLRISVCTTQKSSPNFQEAVKLASLRAAVIFSTEIPNFCIIEF